MDASAGSKQKGHKRRSFASDQREIRRILESLIHGNIGYLDLISKNTLIEKIIHLVLERRGRWENAPPIFSQIIQEIDQYPTGQVRTIVFGGGSGLSSILGGENDSESWAATPFFGLKKSFPNMRVVVCMTDDGGSSGKILQDLPCIALGDIRRAALSLITPSNILAEYPSIHPDNLELLAGFLQKIINYRLGLHTAKDPLWHPWVIMENKVQSIVPPKLIQYLSGLGSLFRRHPRLKEISLTEHCVGNLWLVAAIYQQMERRRLSSQKVYGKPTHRDIICGIQEFSKRIGAGAKTIYPASTTQGELQLLYEHGLISCGEHKSSLRHSSFPVKRAWVNFIDTPRVSSALTREIEQADLIILAPGSLYTSLIPLLQIPSLTAAVRKNRKALKILGANFWAQQGETDISRRRNGKEYCVSDLIEAYHANIPDGINGLFHHIVVTDLQAVPADIIRNYALEEKLPIYLDKHKVTEWGIEPIEAAVISQERLRIDKVIQHDPAKFARVIKALYVLRGYLQKPSVPDTPAPISTKNYRIVKSSKGLLSQYFKAVQERIDAMAIPDRFLRDLLKDIIWDNREILLAHLGCFSGIKVIKSHTWTRSTEWDKILGYFDPDDRFIKIHANLLKGPSIRLVEDILIAIGESLLGDYCLWKKVQPLSRDKESMGKVFEICLKDSDKRNCFLSDQEIRTYLQLAQLLPHRANPNIFYMVVNGEEAFTPPGLLFGLLYAWYLNNQLGGVVEHEMSLLKWEISELIPKQFMERKRKQGLIDFFRTRVFQQRIP